MSDYNNDEQKEKRKVEWSFDLGVVGDRVREFFGSLAGDEELREGEYTVGRGVARQATVKLDLSLGDTTIRALEAGGDLFHAHVKYVGELRFEAHGDEHKIIKLGQVTRPRSLAGPIKQGFRAMASNDDLWWNVGLSPDVPIALNVDAGVGPVDMDLTHLTITDLEVDGGVGSLKLFLPAQALPLATEIDGGVGQVTVVVPAGAHGQIKIDGGVGAINLIIAPDVAVKIKAESGIGSINIASSIPRISGEPEFLSNDGTWQSPGYDVAEKKLTIRYDGGVGSFNVRVQEVV